MYVHKLHTSGTYRTENRGPKGELCQGTEYERYIGRYFWCIVIMYGVTNVASGGRFRNQGTVEYITPSCLRLYPTLLPLWECGKADQLIDPRYWNEN